MRRAAAVRAAVFLAAAAFHIFLLLFVNFRLKTAVPPEETPPGVMKLTDLREAPPETPVRTEETVKTVTDTVAETMIETETITETAGLSPPGETAEPEYLPMHRISVPPQFSESEILHGVDYPPIALRSGIEGTVYLELFVDREGYVRRVTVLKEDPPGRGFAEAAVKAFRNLRGVPAQVNGETSAVRYRYPLRFKLR
jgi:protein TonB